MPAGGELRLAEIERQGGQCAVRGAHMCRHEPRQLCSVRAERCVRHAEWFEDAQSAVIGEIHAADGLHDLAQPVGTDSVVPPGPRVRDQRGTKRSPRASHRFDAGDLAVATHLGAGEWVRQTGCVRDQVVDRHRAGRLAQPRRGAVEPVEDLQVRERRQQLGHRLVQLDLARLE